MLTCRIKTFMCLHSFSTIRGVGCIFFEMASGSPLFPGSTIEDELHLIFKVSQILLLNTE